MSAQYALNGNGQAQNARSSCGPSKKACRATKRNCEVTAFVSANGTTNGMYFIFNQDDFFAHLENQFSFVHAQGHDLIKNSGDKEFHKTQPDPALRNIVWAPLTPSLDARDDYTPWRVESLGTEDKDGEQVLHLRLVPGANARATMTHCPTTGLWQWGMETGSCDASAP